MTPFVRAALIRSTRQTLAIVVLGIALAGAVYLGTSKLDNSGHYPACLSYPVTISHEPGAPPCAPPTRAAWQVPLAILIALVGLAGAVTTTNQRPPQRSGDHLVT